MQQRKVSAIFAFIILPILLLSLGEWMSSLIRVYINSATFSMSIFLGAIITTSYYTSVISNNITKGIFITIFGIIVPILYIQAASVIYGSGIEIHNDTWSPIFMTTGLIGVIEIIMYVGILLITPLQLIGKLFIKSDKND